jgi:hypothetical protein
MNPDAGLSAAGLARREAILDVLVRAQRGRRRRAAAIRGAGAAAIALTIATAWIVASPRPAPRTLAAPARITEAAAPRAPMIAVVRNDPSVLRRLAAPAEPIRVNVIDDQELSRLLVRAGRPTGFIRSGDRFLLASDVPPPDRNTESPRPGRG